MNKEQTPIEQLVKGEFDGLSAAQKKVADYLLLHPDECALLTAKQISREAGVSETTVIRLSYALGFGNFSEMQQKMRERMLQNKSPAYIPPPAETSVQDGKETLGHVIENDILILKQTLHQMNEAEIWRAVDALIRADRVVVAGYRASYGAANWFSFMLGLTRDNVQLCPSGGDDYAALLSLSERSVVVVISFPRYSREVVKFAQQAKRQNATLLSITDRILSPVGRISEITLTTDVNVDTGMISMASAISLLNVLLYGMNLKDRQQYQTRQRLLEHLYAASDIFIE